MTNRFTLICTISVIFVVAVPSNTLSQSFLPAWAQHDQYFPIRYLLRSQITSYNNTVIDGTLESTQTTPQMIERAGYPTEVHQIVTEDDYVLELHRIPRGRSKSSSSSGRNEGPVLIVHGYACTSINWVLNPVTVGLPYKLADSGYDVWLGNFRGNKYSNRHLRFHNNDTRFWNFSFHEMGMYDNPAMIDYVLKVTQEKSLFYVAHSMGGAAFLVTMTKRPEYNELIKAMFALAPVAFFRHVRHTARLIAPFVITDQVALEALGHGELVPAPLLDTLKLLGSTLCTPDSMAIGLCSQFLQHVVGFNPLQLNKTWLPILFRNYPDTSSTKTLLHFLQLVKSGKFCEFDYGVLDNVSMYSTTQPPVYDLSKVTAPVGIYWSADDWLAPPEDIETLVRQLPNVILNHKVTSDVFSHLDFLCAVDSDVLLYNPMMKVMKKYRHPDAGHVPRSQNKLGSKQFPNIQ